MCGWGRCSEDTGCKCIRTDVKGAPKVSGLDRCSEDTGCNALEPM